jgi:hypothetical protein
MAESASPDVEDAELTAKREREYAEAKSKLRLFKVTSTRKLRVPPPVLELHEGANHFELELPEAASALVQRLAELVKTGEVTVETLDGDGNATAWPPAPATSQPTEA